MFDALASLIVACFSGTILRLIVGLATLIIQLGITILSWVLSPDFITYSYTDPARNPIIRVGWTLMRDLTNMSFVIILIFIALGTALRIAQYQAQKTLPLLIIIALLVNFTPVIVGVVVDASNIVMNFFVEKASGFDIMGQQFGAQSASLLGFLRGCFDASSVMALVLQSVVIFVFAFLALVIFLCFAVLFAMRYLAIWILVIISPVAFACYILPSTRKYFTGWWSQLWNWSIIGITAAFFIYLANHLLVHYAEIINTAPAGSTGWFGAQFTGFLNSLMPFVVALLFLIIGFFMSLKTSAIGASGVVSGFQRFARSTVPGYVGRSKPVQQAKRTAARAGAAMARAPEAIARRMDQAAARVPILRYPLQAVTKPLRAATWVLRTSTAPALMKIATQEQKQKVPPGFEDLSPHEQMAIISDLSNDDKLPLLKNMAEKDNFEKTPKAWQDEMTKVADNFSRNPRWKSEVAAIKGKSTFAVNRALKINFEIAKGATQEAAIATVNKEIDEVADEMKNDPGLRHNIQVNASMRTGKAIGNLTQDDIRDEIGDFAARVQFMRQLKDPSDMTKEDLDSNAARYASHKYSGAKHQKIYDKHGSDTMDKMLNGRFGLNTMMNNDVDVVNWFKQNPRAASWAATNPAAREMNLKAQQIIDRRWSNTTAFLNQARLVARPAADFQDYDTVRRLSRDDAIALTRYGDEMQRGTILYSVKWILGIPRTAPLMPVAGPGRTHGVDNALINYIVDQQVAGRWPV